jgi:acyl-CoA thioesterase
VRAEYDRDIWVNPEPEPGTPGRHAGRYAADLSAGWAVGGGLNGGYLLGVLANAIRHTLPDKPDPISVSAYYLSAGVAGPATITTELKRDGGSVATVAADLVQDGVPRISALATYGDLSRLPEHTETIAEEPDFPPREQCVPNTMAPAEMRAMVPMMARYEMLFHPDHVGWAVGQPSGEGVISAWFRLKDGREPDPISLLTVVDLLPPVTFDLGKPGWAPTLELTVHVRAVPAPGWLKVRHATKNVAGGMFEEDCEVWDTAGRLVAQSRQLARLPR